MMTITRAIQFLPRDDKDAYRSLGVIRMPARKIKDVARGIEYDQPEGYFAQTWMGNIQLAVGDWVITCASGNRYVVKQFDYYPGGAFKVPFLQKLKGLFK